MRWKTQLKELIISLAGFGPVARLIRALRRSLLAILPSRVVCKVPMSGRIRAGLPGGTALVLVSDGRDSIATAVFWNGLEGYEPEVTSLFLRLLPHSRTIFDVGANTGLYALIAAVTDPSNRVYAFEPHPRIFPYLARNVKVNGLANLTAEPVAVSNRDGEIPFYLPSTVSLSLSASTLKGFRRSREVRTVPAVTIDRYVTTHGIERVDLLKIDTEATEPLVLEGAAATVDRDRPLIICEVLKSRTEEALHAFFRDRRYRFFHVTREALVPMQTLAGDPTWEFKNFLFVPESRVAEVTGRGGRQP